MVYWSRDVLEVPVIILWKRMGMEMSSILVTILIWFISIVAIPTEIFFNQNINDLFYHCINFQINLINKKQVLQTKYRHRCIIPMLCWKYESKYLNEFGMITERLQLTSGPKINSKPAWTFLPALKNTLQYDIFST